MKHPVALHPEGVDRNSFFVLIKFRKFWSSPSTRRAWIEIILMELMLSLLAVALHPEGVDRNDYVEIGDCEKCKSPSTRRAWIEIFWRLSM